MPIVGSGDYRYEVVPSWPKMPKYWSFGKASDVAVNSSDEVHVFSRSAHPLTIWDTDGVFLSSWGEGTTSGNEHGIYIAPNNNVWLVDANYHTATEHTPDGTLVRTLGKKLWPSSTYGGRPFNMPTGLALAHNGDIFVSDGYGSRRVHKFSPDGELLLSWGKPGEGPGEFALLHNIWVDVNSRVFICDRENDRIQIFDDQGNFLQQWTDLQAPGDLWMRGDTVYVVEQGGGCAVSIWTLDGDLITRWRGSEGPGKGTLDSGHGICVDSQGSIYVTELSGLVRKFRRA
jgi:DNA-binding beta-propeller fold protein YncE